MLKRSSRLAGDLKRGQTHEEESRPAPRLLSGLDPGKLCNMPVRLRWKNPLCCPGSGQCWHQVGPECDFKGDTVPHCSFLGLPWHGLAHRAPRTCERDASPPLLGGVGVLTCSPSGRHTQSPSLLGHSQSPRHCPVSLLRGPAPSPKSHLPGLSPRVGSKSTSLIEVPCPWRNATCQTH